MGFPLTRNSATQALPFFMVLASDHLSAAVGLSPTVTIRKPGGAFAAPVGAVSEVSAGWYEIAGHASDSDVLGPLLLHAVAPGADPTDDVFPVVAYNPLDSVRLDLSGVVVPDNASIAAILARLNAAGTTVVVAVVVPVAAGEVTLVSGDDYRAADGLALTWRVLTDLDLFAAQSLTLFVYDGVHETAAPVLAAAVSAAAVTDGYDLSADLTAAQTASMEPRYSVSSDPPRYGEVPAESRRRYEVVAVLSNGHVRTLLYGYLVMTE